MHGVPVFRGTRVPVQTLFDYLEGGESRESFLEGFPTVSRDSALQALAEVISRILSTQLVAWNQSIPPAGALEYPFCLTVLPRSARSRK